MMTAPCGHRDRRCGAGGGVAGAAARPGLLVALATMPERRLFALIVAVRLALVALVLACHDVVPALVGYRSFAFDTGEALYDDPRLPALRNWDSVHFFHIAQHGYSHENLMVFFPFVPFVLRGISASLAWLTEAAAWLPGLAAVMPPPVLVFVALNVVAGAATGVVLRRLTVLTLLGDEALRELTTAATGRRAVGRDHGTSSIFDEWPVPPPSLSHQPGAWANVEPLVLAWREVGAAVVFWLVSNASVFTVVAYTESLFALFTVSGVLLIAQSWNWRAVDVVPPAAPPSTAAPTITVRSTAASVWREAAATACFVGAATVRSNGFVAVGFVVYPLVLQVFFPETFRRRVLRGRDVVRGTASSPCAARVPSWWRLAAVAAQVLAIVTPYLAMNGFGHQRFARGPPGHATAASGKPVPFWGFYGALQEKYWNVGFLRAYTVGNSPNVLVSLPLAVAVLAAAYQYYAKAAVRAAWASRRAPRRGSCVPLLTGCWRTVEQLAQSANMVYLLFHLALALLVMHVQVMNRFIAASPALYWLLGRQLGRHPHSHATALLLRFSIAWIFIGCLLFANHLPWT